ncbi:hypothetical protein GPD46_004455 [Salmonella enterica]|nr:hypothetical protein [Salmonella enterica]
MVQYNKYSTIHTIHVIQIIHTVRIVHTPPLFFHSDPKKASPGSSSPAPARSGAETQDVRRYKQSIHLYIVLHPYPVPRPAGAENSDMIIPSPCYTSGNGLIMKKSDLTKT